MAADVAADEAQAEKRCHVATYETAMCHTCVFMCACVSAHVCACVRVCVCARVCVCD